MRKFDVPPENGLSRAEASAAFRKRGLNPRIWLMGLGRLPSLGGRSPLDHRQGTSVGRRQASRSACACHARAERRRGSVARRRQFQHIQLAVRLTAHRLADLRLSAMGEGPGNRLGADAPTPLLPVLPVRQ